MRLSDQLEELKSARARGEDWTSLAERIQAIDKAGHWRQTYSTRTDWLHALQQLTGYAGTTLRRFLEARQFIDELAAEKPHLDIVGAFCNPDTKVSGIAMITLIKRIHSIAPESLDSILPSVMSGEMTVLQLQAFYDKQVLTGPANSVNQAKVAGRSTQEFVSRAFDALEASLPALTGEVGTRLFRKRFKFGLVSPDAVAVGASQRSVEFADGFEIRQIGALPAPWLKNRVLAEVSFAAPFFRHYWLILPAGSELSPLVIETWRMLGRSTIGVGELDANGTLEVKSQPHGIPTPDHREIALQQIFQQGVPQAA